MATNNPRQRMPSLRPSYSPSSTTNCFLALTQQSPLTPTTPTRLVSRSANDLISLLSPSSYKEAVVPTTATSSSSLPGSWHAKPNPVYILHIEPEHDDYTFKQLFNIYFYTDTHFQSTNLHKTREWYETLLIATKSVEISHAYQPDRNDPKKEHLAYSKCKILQVYTPDAWKASAYTTPIAFPAKMIPSAYTYYDYIQAWSRFLFIRPCTHSWFFYFIKSCPQ